MSAPQDYPDVPGRRQIQTVQTQTKPVYPSYHLAPTTSLPNKHRPSDNYRPHNILRSSSKPIHVRFPESSEEAPPGPVRPIRAMEEFIAVVFENEVWMGLVDFKGDKPLPEDKVEDGFVRDLKRTSIVMIPRMFKTQSMMPLKFHNPISEDGEYERRVEFDMGGNNENEEREELPYRASAPPGPWLRKYELRRKEKKESGKERVRRYRLREKPNTLREPEKREVPRKEKPEPPKETVIQVKEKTVEIPNQAKESEQKKGPNRTLRKEQPPPSGVLIGYKYPVAQPKSILKKTESYPPAHPQTMGSGDITFVKQARPVMNRQEGEFWSQSWREQNEDSKIRPSAAPSDRPTPPPPRPRTTVLPTVYESPTNPTVQPTEEPILPRHSSQVLSPAPRRTTLPSNMAEQILGRLTPDSAYSRYSLPRSTRSSTISFYSSEEEEDWSTTISSPTAFFQQERFLPAHLTSLKVGLKTEIYSPHPAGATPSSPSQAYSRIVLIDILDSPVQEANSSRLQWWLPYEGKREYDNRLYYPVGLTLYGMNGTVEVEEDFTYLGEGRFWCGGFMVAYSSRRMVNGDVYMVKSSLREECAWLNYVEAEIDTLNRWMELGDGKENGGGEVGQWRDESGRAVKRELRPEMLI